MSQYPKSGNIRPCMSMMFYHYRSPMTIKTSHGAHRRVHHILGLLHRKNIPFRQLGPLGRSAYPPFVNIDGHLRPQRLRQHHNVAHLGPIALDVLPLRTNRRGHPADHGPGIQHRLPPRDRRPGLQARVVEPAHHLARANITIVLGHIPARREQHEHEIAVAHALGVQVAEDVGGPDPSLEVRAVHEREEEVGGAYAHVSLARGADGTVQGDSAVGRAEVLAVAEVEGD
mmetsp:Transcript_17029/g.40822  ORF Transcript_17029/g.40822 Transcript_17029/m.40822 type:complete len:229 (-) Transcript_17029:263-949(-)